MAWPIQSNAFKSTVAAGRFQATSNAAPAVAFQAGTPFALP